MFMYMQNITRLIAYGKFMIMHTYCSFILAADIEKLLHEEQDYSEADGWKFLSKNDFCEVWRKAEENQSAHLVKVRRAVEYRGHKASAALPGHMN